MMKIENLTPHPINLLQADGQDITVPPSGTVARVASTPGALQDRPGLPVPVALPDVVGAVEGLPEPVEGTVYIVSGRVGDHVSRQDVFVPGTGPKDDAVRNDKGHIIAVTRLKAT